MPKWALFQRFFQWSSRSGQIRTFFLSFISCQRVFKTNCLRAIFVIECNQHPVIVQENGIHKNFDQCFLLFLLRYIEFSEKLYQ